MRYSITDWSGQVHEFDNWLDAIKFAVQQAKLDPQTPVKVSSGLTHYQVWANGEIDRLAVYCACDICKLCNSPDGSASCPHYWERCVWEYYDTISNE